MVQEGVPQFLNWIIDFLHVPIIDFRFVFIDFWSLVHFTSGLILMILIIRFSCKLFPRKSKAFNWFFMLLVALLLWEYYEWSYYRLDEYLFLYETPVDVLWDMIAGLLGGVLAFVVERGWSGRAKRVRTERQRVARKN